MIIEAGGVISDFSGGNRWFERGNIVGAPPGIHAELIAMIRRHVSEEQLAR
jgi:myo-inositol-1(or 4)-monophosphatase